jgi:hypothetical protein
MRRFFAATTIAVLSFTNAWGERDLATSAVVLVATAAECKIQITPNQNTFLTALAVAQWGDGWMTNALAIAVETTDRHEQLSPTNQLKLCKATGEALSKIPL